MAISTVARRMSESGGRRLLLFDIDGTLITSGGAGEAALIDAMRTRFGVNEDLKGISLAGATDALIARKLLAGHGIEASPENLSALLDAYVGHLSERISKHAGRLMPGILELLEKLKNRPDCVLALLTGNVVRGAQIKLAHYGVWDFFEFGAFGDDHDERNELGRFATTRAYEAHGVEFPPSRIYVIGDTPRDIECGKAIGAKTVAIATGIYSADDLRSHMPDFLFEDLADVDSVIGILTGS